MSDSKGSNSGGKTARWIYNDKDMEAWKSSPLKAGLLRVVGAMGKSCSNAASSFHYDPENPLRGLSPAMASLHGSLTKMLSWCEQDFPPVGQTGATRLSIRFGNPAFRSWHHCLEQRSGRIVSQMYLAHQEGLSLEESAEKGGQAAQGDAGMENTASGSDQEILLELASYLHDAFGHPIRLDYGTGHESSFMVFLYAACKLGWMDPVAAKAKQPPSMDSLKATTISIFHAYLKVTRQLQLEYRLEPAGSHGVWGLDDYHCLPFYFGACQCIPPSLPTGDDTPEPSEITDEALRKQHANSLLYFGCMDYICTLKRGAPLFECSPMLYDISQTCPTWAKVSAGLIKLYEGEVLNKRQVVQHFTFGKHLFVATWEHSQGPLEPPAEGFRDTEAAVAPMVRAPWARDSASVPPGGVPMGRAPWSNQSGPSSAATGMPPTKAPWAK
jgi:serine/threonine-protein phosphatase 2A activator